MSESSAWPDQPLVEPLTDRELEILSLMAQHRTNREIADTLILSLNTVKWYARQIYGKLGGGGRTGTGRVARRARARCGP